MTAPFALSLNADITAPTGAKLLPNYDRVIGLDASTWAWFVPDTAYITLTSGKVSAWANRKSGGPTITQGTAGVRPVVGGDATILGRPYLRFTSTNQLPLTGFPAGASLSWSKILVARQYGSGIPKAAALFSSANSAGRHLLSTSVTTGNVAQTVGSPDVATNNVIAPDWSQWLMIIASWDHTTGTAGLYISTVGGSFSTNTNALAVASLTSMTIGSSGDVDYAAIGVDTTALHLTANLAKLNWWKQWVRDRFGLTVA